MQVNFVRAVAHVNDRLCFNKQKAKIFVGKLLLLFAVSIKK